MILKREVNFDMIMGYSMNFWETFGFICAFIFIPMMISLCIAYFVNQINVKKYDKKAKKNIYNCDDCPVVRELKDESRLWYEEYTKAEKTIALLTTERNIKNG